MGKHPARTPPVCCPRPAGPRLSLAVRYRLQRKRSLAQWAAFAALATHAVRLMAHSPAAAVATRVLLQSTLAVRAPCPAGFPPCLGTFIDLF